MNSWDQFILGFLGVVEVFVFCYLALQAGFCGADVLGLAAAVGASHFLLVLSVL